MIMRDKIIKAFERHGPMKSIDVSIAIKAKHRANVQRALAQMVDRGEAAIHEVLQTGSNGTFIYGPPKAKTVEKRIQRVLLQRWAGSISQGEAL